MAGTQPAHRPPVQARFFHVGREHCLAGRLFLFLGCLIAAGEQLPQTGERSVDALGLPQTVYSLIHSMVQISLK